LNESSGTESESDKSIREDTRKKIRHSEFPEADSQKQPFP